MCAARVFRATIACRSCTGPSGCRCSMAERSARRRVDSCGCASRPTRRCCAKRSYASGDSLKPGCSNEPSISSRKSLRSKRGPQAGVRGIPSPFIKIYERGRDTPHPSLLPLVPTRKGFLDEVLAFDFARRRDALAEGHGLHQTRLAHEGLIQQVAHYLEQYAGALGVDVGLMRPGVAVAAEQH